jgi:hypothetical protein
VDSGHGRVEVRGSEWVPDLSTLPKPEQWKDLQGIARVECERHLGDRLSTEVRYSINLLRAEGRALGQSSAGPLGH